MIRNSVLLLLLITLLFSTTLAQDKSTSPQTKITTVTAPAKTSNQFSLDSELNKIVNILSSGNISQLAAAITAVTNNNNIDCKDKASFIKQATELMKKRLSSNEQQLKILQTQAAAPTVPDKNTGDLKNMLSNLKNSLVQKNYAGDLRTLETERKQILENLTKYWNISNDYLNKLNDYKKKYSIESDTTNQDKALLKLGSQLQALDTIINQTSRKRSELHKNLTTIKVNLLNQEIKLRQGISLQKLEADYRSYSELALQAGIKAKSKQQQLNRLTLSLKSKQLSRTAVDDEIDKATKALEDKKQSNGQKAIQLIGDANTVLNQNVKNVDSKISSLNSDCFL